MSSSRKTLQDQLKKLPPICYKCFETDCICSNARATCPHCRRASKHMLSIDRCEYCGKTRFSRQDTVSKSFGEKHIGSKYDEDQARSAYRGKLKEQMSIMSESNVPDVHYSRTGCVSPRSKAAYISKSDCPPCGPSPVWTPCLTDEPVSYLQVDTKEGTIEQRYERVTLKYKCDETDKLPKAGHWGGQ